MIECHGTAAYGETARWAEAIHRDLPDFDGLLWTSRQQNEGLAMLLFGTRVKSGAMENEHVLGGLLRKRAEIAAELEEAQSRVRRLVVDIDAVDTTIRMFSAMVDLAEIKPKQLPTRHAAHHGEIQRAIYAALRETGETLTTRDVTIRVMASRSLNVSDAMFVRTMQKRVGAAMRQLREKSRVRSERLNGGQIGWRLAS